jgi:hypothetical protein
MANLLPKACELGHFVLAAAIMFWPTYSQEFYVHIVRLPVAFLPNLVGYLLRAKKGYAFCFTLEVLVCCSVICSILGAPTLVALLNREMLEEFGVDKPGVRAAGTIVGIAVGAILAFFGTLGVCLLLDALSSSDSPQFGAVGWIFCFITMPLGALAGGTCGQLIFHRVADRKDRAG